MRWALNATAWSPFLGTEFAAVSLAVAAGLC